MDPQAAKMIGAGIACIGMGGAGVGVGTIFGHYLADCGHCAGDLLRDDQCRALRAGHDHRRVHDRFGLRAGGDWTGLAGRPRNPYRRCLGRPGVHLGRGPEVGRLPHGARRADGARGHPERRSDIDALRGAAVHREADRAGIDFRRPSGDRHRERSPVRGNPGQEPSSWRSCSRTSPRPIP